MNYVRGDKMFLFHCPLCNSLPINLHILALFPPNSQEGRRRGMKASVATATRYDSVACDERNFSSSEERALAP